MPLPVAAGWLLGVLGRWGLKLLLPLLIAFGVWVLEELTGVVGWALTKLVDAVLMFLMGLIGDLDLPAPPDWVGTFGAGLIDLLHLIGVHNCLLLIFASVLARLAVKLITIGRY